MNKTLNPNPQADFMPSLGSYKPLAPFRYWCQKVLPLVYDDSLSYYELLCKVVDFLNKTMEDVQTLHGDVTNLYNAYIQLQQYINTYFDNLDVQQEINNKLDEMIKDGTFNTIFPDFDIIDKFVLKYPEILMLTDNLTPLEGIGGTALNEYSANDFYALFNSLMTPNNYYTLTSETIGYANNACNDGEDTTLPILCYHYSPIKGTVNTNDYKRKKIILTSGIHGNEKGPIYALYLWMKYGVAQQKQKYISEVFGSYDIDIIPVCNPFGVNETIGATIQQLVSNIGRLNARGVNLNRNFTQGWTATAESGTAPLSEQESKALDKYFSATNWDNVVFYFDVHSTTHNIGAETKEFYFQINSNDEKILQICSDSYCDYYKYMFDEYGFKADQQTLNKYSFIANPAGQLFSQTELYKGNKYGVGFFETPKYYQTGDVYVPNDHRTLELYYSILYTCFYRLSNALNINTQIETDLNKWNSIGLLFGDNYNQGQTKWGNIVYTDTADITKFNYSMVRLSILPDQFINQPEIGFNVDVMCTNPDYSFSLYFVNTSGAVDGNSGWQTGLYTYSDSKYNRIYLSIRKGDGTENIPITQLYRDFGIFVKITPKTPAV